MNTTEDWLDWIDSKFGKRKLVRWGKEYYWFLSEWIYYGNSFGIEMYYDIEKDQFTMKQMVESGYATGQVLLDKVDFDTVYKWLDVLAPKNPDFKTDRK